MASLVKDKVPTIWPIEPHTARREVDQILTVLATWPERSTIATIADVRSATILLELREVAAAP